MMSPQLSCVVILAIQRENADILIHIRFVKRGAHAMCTHNMWYAGAHACVIGAGAQVVR